MIKLTELLHTISDEKEKNMTPIDDWKITDADHMYDMGFTADGMYSFGLKRPRLKVSHKRDEGFIVNDESQKKRYALPKFEDVIKFFEKYEQQWENQPYK